MTKAQKWTYDDCKIEAEYIASVNALSPGAAFNNDPKCFARYCNMQANQMRHSGFHLMALDILQYRDIAEPNYRTNNPGDHPLFR